ncbi:MAG: DUF2190 family protein [Deltaproteobacteria bacterium]|nr:DUF2190 family protein [Deltaproteobacteria bacterium]
MSQNPNQRLQNTEQGQVDLLINPAILTAQIASAESEDLAAGSPVKLSDVAGAIPQFLLATADDDDIFGYIVRNIKDQTVSALGYCEIAFSGSVMYMTSGAAIARGAKVESDVSEIEVITQSANPAIGIALDKATAASQLIRVLITAPGSSIAGAFTTLSASGAVTFGDTLGVTGIATLAALLNADGGIAVDTDKFTVSAAGAVALALGLVVGGNTTHTGIVIDDVNDYSAGAGALPITKPVIALTTGGAEALTLADGVEGQRLTIKMVSDGGDGTVTPANLLDGSTLTFDNTDVAELIFLGTSWALVGTPTATLA